MVAMSACCGGKGGVSGVGDVGRAFVHCCVMSECVVSLDSLCRC